MNSISQRQPFMAFVSQRSNLFLQLAGLVLLLGLAFLPAAAQQTTGSLVGTVKDAQGALVTTATVKATNVDTGFSRSAPANGYGEYRIDYLPVGKYTVEVTAPGFERFVQKNVALDVGQTLAVNITLAVGAQTQTITVTEAPPMVNTSDATLGRTIEPAEIIGLPLVNRNAYAELSLTPGIMANSAGATSSSAAHPQFPGWTAVHGYPDQRRPRLRQRNRRILSGRRKQHYRYAQLRQPGSQPRRHRRVPRRYQRILGGIRPILRRCRLRHHKVGNKPVSRQLCSSSTAIPTSMLIRGKSPHPPARPLSTAITSAAPSAAPSSRISPSSSSVMPVCARYKAHPSQALWCPRLTSAWATLPGTG